MKMVNHFIQSKFIIKGAINRITIMVADSQIVLNIFNDTSVFEVMKIIGS
jgi:hypothetical protein